MPPERLHIMLDACYTAAISREEGVGCLAGELANPRCVATIAWQKELIGA